MIQSYKIICEHRTSCSRRYRVINRDSRTHLLFLLARDRAIEWAGRRNLRANENICGRTHILSEREAAIIPSTDICRTRIQERYTFEEYWQARFSICCHVAAAGAGNYSYSLYSRPRRAPNKNLAARCKTREGGKGGCALRLESIT